MTPNKYRISYADPKMGRPKTNKASACTSYMQVFFVFPFMQAILHHFKTKNPWLSPEALFVLSGRQD